MKWGLSYTEAQQLACDINACEPQMYRANTNPDRRCGGLGSEQGKPSNFYYVVELERIWWPGKTIYVKDAEAFAALCEMDMTNPYPS